MGASVTPGLGMETGRDGKGRSASVVTCTRKVGFLTNRPPCLLDTPFLCPFPKIKIEKRKEKKKKGNPIMKPNQKAK